MTEASFIDHFSKYVPERAAQIFFEWTDGEPISYRITKPRTSKLGDFRAPVRGTPARISINGNLNPFSFMVTFAHEFAHYLDFKARLTLKNPHGEPWKKTYSMLLGSLVNEQLFPSELDAVMQQHLNNPKAASCSDPELNSALKAYDEHALPSLKDIPDHSIFRLKNGMVFRRGPLRRTRYRCQEVDSGRWYLVHGQAEVETIDAMTMNS